MKNTIVIIASMLIFFGKLNAQTEKCFGNCGGVAQYPSYNDTDIRYVSCSKAGSGMFLFSLLYVNGKQMPGVQGDYVAQINEFLAYLYNQGYYTINIAKYSYGGYWIAGNRNSIAEQAAAETARRNQERARIDAERIAEAKRQNQQQSNSQGYRARYQERKPQPTANTNEKSAMDYVYVNKEWPNKSFIRYHYEYSIANRHTTRSIKVKYQHYYGNKIYDTDFVTVQPGDSTFVGTDNCEADIYTGIGNDCTFRILSASYVD